VSVFPVLSLIGCGTFADFRPISFVLSVTLVTSVVTFSLLTHLGL
jgi:hypothetical protein